MSRIWMLCLFAVTLNASAESFQTLSPGDHLRRLSLITRGKPPAIEDRKVLEVADNQKSFFQEMAKTYVNSADFNSRMLSNLNRLFLVREPFDGSTAQFSSLHLLFGKIVNENRSWDELLTSQAVGISSDNNMGTSTSFYRSVLTLEESRLVESFIAKSKVDNLFFGSRSASVLPSENVSDHGQYFNLSSPTVAGVLSNDVFLNRYWTTPVNQNRKRAAAVFRIFLCDEMRAVILPDAAARQALVEAGLDREANAKPMTVAMRTAVNQHASDVRCAACHDKLDPLANVFRTTSSDLNPTTVAGKLTYKRKSGALVSVPFRNAQELAQALIKQPEYASCQVKYFWNWFIGEDYPLSSKVEAELVAKFNEVGRRPRDFAEYIVNRPEFYNFPRLTVEEVQFRHVSNLFRDCQSCHASNAEAPSFTKIPFDSMYFVDHASIVEKLVKVLDLLGDGSKASMPPVNAGWKIQSADRARLLAWMANGAPDDQGRITWSNPAVQEALRNRLKEERISFQFRPTFDNTVRRFVTMEEFARQVKQLGDEIATDKAGEFPYGLKLHPSYNDKSSVQTYNLETGAGMTAPNGTFIEGISLMAGMLASKALSGTVSDDYLQAMNLAWIADLPRIPGSSLFYRSFDYPIHVNAEVCARIGKSLFERIVGSPPNEQEQYALQNFAARLTQQKISLADCTQRSMRQILLSNRNLTY